MRQGAASLAKAAHRRESAVTESMMPNTARNTEQKPEAPDPQLPRERKGISAEGRKWLEENAEAMAAWQAWVEKNGLPLEHLRTF